ALGFAVASVAVAKPAAAFASSGYGDDNGKDDKYNNCDCKSDDRDHKGGYDEKGDKSYDHHNDDKCDCKDYGKDHKDDKCDNNDKDYRWSDYKDTSYNKHQDKGDDNCDNNDDHNDNHDHGYKGDDNK